MRRLYDRGACCRKLKKETRNPDGDECCTRQELQTELQNLYTGPQIFSHAVYAQLFANMWCCMMYSSGLPILYPIACIFNVILYWATKILLLKYHQRTHRFNEELAIQSIHYIKFGVFVHMVVGAWMFSTEGLLSQSPTDAIKAISVVVDDVGGSFLQARFSSAHSQLYLTICVIAVLLYVF